jgi:DNA-directed RNA polymerase specialized sigma24 family protein
VLENKRCVRHAGRVKSAPPLQFPGGGPQFVTTRWSLILAQGFSDAGSSARNELAQLCQIYWRPIFAFICRRGYPASDAQDLTQNFFVMILKGKLFASADPERGHFRCFLLKSLKNFLMDMEKSRRRHKRGGDFNFISWEQWMAEAPSQLLMSARALESCSAEALFDVRWAASVAERALLRLREECESRGHRRMYETLRDHLAADRTEISYDRLSEMLGVPASVVKRLLHEFRVRYRRLLREEVAATVENDADVDQEIRYLCMVLSGFAP